MSQLRWAARASADLDELNDYLETHSPAIVPGVMRGILRAIRRIEAFPASAPVAFIGADGTEYRAAVAGNYLLYYELLDGEPVVTRLRDARRAPPEGWRPA